MCRSGQIDRRAFVEAAGLGFLAALQPRGLLALERADAVYASGIRTAKGSFAVATVTERGEIVDQVELPARAHGMAFSPVTGKTVAFARRPGTFAMIFDPRNKAEPSSPRSKAVTSTDTVSFRRTAGCSMPAKTTSTAIAA